MVTLRNYELYAGSANALVGAAVAYYAATLAHPNPGSVLGTTLTDASGMWEFTGLAVGSYDVKITAPGAGMVKWYKGMAAVSGTVVGVGGITTTEILDGTIVTADIAANAITQRAQSSGFTGNRTAAGFADVDSTNGKVTMTTAGGDLIAWFYGSTANGTVGVIQRVAIRLDSGAEVAIVPAYSIPGAASYPVPFCGVALFAGFAAGSHTVYARHTNDSAVGTLSTAGQLVVVEFKK